MTFQACNKGMVGSDAYKIVYTLLLKRLLHEITVLINIRFGIIVLKEKFSMTLTAGFYSELSALSKSICSVLYNQSSDKLSC